MRSPLDRLRHALSFEIIALLLIVPLGAIAFAMPAHHIGAVGFAGATLATVWNLIYNYGFDRALRRLTGTTQKSLRVRALHAVLFELGLLVALLPVIAWMLDISLWRALVMDLYFAGFYIAYAFAFNWAYDRLFPLPDWRNAPQTA